MLPMRRRANRAVELTTIFASVFSVSGHTFEVSPPPQLPSHAPDQVE